MTNFDFAEYQRQLSLGYRVRLSIDEFLRQIHERRTNR